MSLFPAVATDRRFAIVPGRAFCDGRIGLTHLRLLGRLGSHIDRNGWCRVRQDVLASAIGLARETVNRRLRDLVGWGYVEAHHTETTGRSIFYRVLLDPPGGVAPSEDGGPDELGVDDDGLADDDGFVADVEDDADAADDALFDLGVVNDADRDDGDMLQTHGDPAQNRTCDAGVTCRIQPKSHSRCDVQEITPGVTHRGSHRTNILTSISTPSPPTPIEADATRRGGGEGQRFLQGTGGKRSTDRQLAVGWGGCSDLLGPTASGRTPDGSADAAECLIRLMGLLQPPRGVAPATYAGLLAADLRQHGPAVLARFETRVIAERVRDMPPLAHARAWLADIAAAVDAERRADEAAAEREALERETLARLTPGVEAEAAPPRRDALRLRRAFVEATLNGPLLENAWLTGVLVLECGGPRLKLSLPTRVEANHCGSSGGLYAPLLAAARRLWPDTAYIDAVTHGSAASFRSTQDSTIAQSASAAP